MPSGATGIIAGILAGLGAVAGLGGGLLGGLGLTGLSAFESDTTAQTSAGIVGGLLPALVLGLVLNIVAGLLLARGSVLLLQRKGRGRRLVVAGCAVTIGATLLSLGYVAGATLPYGPLGAGGFTLISLICAVTTLLMALMPSTTAWINAKRNPLGPY